MLGLITDLEPGGLRTIALLQLGTLRSQGYAVEICGDAPSSSLDEHEPYLHRIAMPKRVMDVRKMIASHSALRRILRAKKFDAIVAYGFRSCLLLALSHTPSTKFFVNIGQFPKQRIKRYLLSIMSKTSHIAITSSTGSVGWTFAPFLTADAATISRTKFQTGTFPPVVVWFGRLDSPKRPDVWLEIFSALKERLPIQGRIVGAGPYLGQLKRQVQERQLPISFHGWSSASTAFRNASLSIFWSDSEGQLPVAAQESIMCGVPILVNRLASIDDFCGREFRGVVSDVSDAVEGAYQILRGDSESVWQDQRRLLLGRSAATDMTSLLLRSLNSVHDVGDGVGEKAPAAS